MIPHHTYDNIRQYDGSKLIIEGSDGTFVVIDAKCSLLKHNWNFK
jgi:hypothetical protein